VTNGYTQTDADRNAYTAVALQAAVPVAPPPAAKEPAPIDMSTAKGASDALATTMVQGFVEQMKAAAKAKGGHLTVQDMEDLQAEFDRQTQALSGALGRSFGAYVKAQERSNFDQQRHSPLTG
jgi:hypothetical protein